MQTALLLIVGLSPQLIDWVEEHFQLRKLKNDYPHWDDVAPPRTGAP